MSAHALTVVGWPGLPLPLPSYVRWRFHLDEQTSRLRTEPLHGATTTARGDTCLALSELRLDDPAGVVGFLNDVGAPVDLAVTEFSLADVERIAAAVREGVLAWRVLAGEPAPTGLELARTALGDADPAMLRIHAAELLSATLALELRPLHPIVWLSLGTYNGDLAAARDLSLRAICFAELYNHVVAGASYRACQNESCGRLFAAKTGGSPSGRRRSLYCSRACAHAQAQREFRRRRAQGMRQA